MSISKLSVEVLFDESVTEQVTVVSPTAKVDPEVCEQDTTKLVSTASVALTVKLITFPDGPIASSMMSAGSIRRGAVVSSTVIVKVAEDVLPA